MVMPNFPVHHTCRQFDSQFPISPLELIVEFFVQQLILVILK